MGNDFVTDFSRMDIEEVIDDSSDNIEDYYLISEKLEHIDQILRFVNYYDSDIIFLFFLSKKTQCDIGDILEKTQPAISYDINRIKHQVMVSHNFINDSDRFFDFLMNGNHNFTAQECDYLLVFLYSSSIAKTAKVFERHQFTIKSYLVKIFEVLELEHPDMFSLLMDSVKQTIKIKKKVLFSRKSQQNNDD